jgi:hypothetical protein
MVKSVLLEGISLEVGMSVGGQAGSASLLVTIRIASDHCAIVLHARNPFRYHIMPDIILTLPGQPMLESFHPLNPLSDGSGE